MNVRWQVEQILTAWLEADEPGEQVPVLTQSDNPGTAPHVEEWPVGALVHELWTDHAPLPATTAHDLRLPADSTFAHVVRLLWTVRHDDIFPAQSWGEAAAHLRSLPSDVVSTYHRAVEDALSARHDGAHDPVR